MKKIVVIIFILSFKLVNAQELYVFTEPASNRPDKSMGVRLGYKSFKMTHDNKFSAYRLDPEIIFGVSKKVTLNLNGYASNMFQIALKHIGSIAI